MGKLILAGAVFAILGIVGFVLRTTSKSATRESDKKTMKTFSFVSFIAAFVVPGLIILFSTFRVVPAGHVGVPILFGEVQETPLSEGLNIVNPLYDVDTMTVKILKHEGDYSGASKDLQEVNIKMIMNFRLNSASAPVVRRTIGVSPDDWTNTIINPAAQEVLKATVALYNASEILKQRPMIKAEVQEKVGLWLRKYGINLIEVSLAEIGFSEEYSNAIEQKQLKEQLAEQKKHELKQAELEAKIRAARAKGEADAFRERAKGRADALKIEGAAQAEYNTRVAESLTPTLVQYKYLERWNGKLPNFMAGNNTGVLFQINPNHKQGTDK